MKTLTISWRNTQKRKWKKNTKTFCKGLQSTCTHILTALANLDALLAFVVDCNDKGDAVTTPIIITFIRKFADLLVSPEFKNFEHKFIEDHPCIPHNILCMFQQLLAEAATITDSTQNVNLAIAKKDIPAEVWQTLFDLRRPYQKYGNVIDIEHAWCIPNPCPFIR